MRRHRILPCMRIAMLAAIILVGAAMPTPAHAAPLSPDLQEQMKRLMLGLLQQQTPPATAGEFVGTATLCLQDRLNSGVTRNDAWDECVLGLTKMYGISLDRFVSALHIGGRWRVYDGYMKRWGTIDIIYRATPGSDFSGTLSPSGGPSASTGGAAKFDIDISSEPDTYEFSYSTGDDRGRGFVQWIHAGCRMHGLFVSDQNADPNTGRPITSYLVFRRC